MPSAPDISFGFGKIDPALWATVPADRPLPLQQHWAYGETLKAVGADVDQLSIVADNQQIGLALIGRRRFYGILKIASLMRGPIWLENSELYIPAALKALRKTHNRWRWNFLALQPEFSDTESNRKLLRKAGYRRVMTGYSTIWADLRPDTDTLRATLNGKWRNQLAKAESGKLDIAIGGRKQHQYAWLTDKEALQQTQRGYQAVPVGLVPIYAEIANRFMLDDHTCGVMSVTALAGRKKVAGAIFLLHGNSATYHVGWSGEDGRKQNAQNRVLWEGILALKGRGIRFLDLGGINTAEGAGIARFKLGLGANPAALVGTYL